jgi:hypothetical protein
MSPQRSNGENNDSHRVPTQGEIFKHQGDSQQSIRLFHPWMFPYAL